jgi:arginine decarboxylase
VVDHLKDAGYLGCLKMLHYHQGSQIPNIAAIREGATEAVRMYCDLVKEGAPMGVLDIGGGMAVDYDGSHTNFHSSCNYSVGEYCTDIIEVVSQICDKAGVAPEPHFRKRPRRRRLLLGARFQHPRRHQRADQREAAPPSRSMRRRTCQPHRRQQDAQQEEPPGKLQRRRLLPRPDARPVLLRQRHLRERGLAEAWFWHILTRISNLIEQLDDIPEDLRELSSTLVDFYYGNFSLFQSLPDSWAIDQLFPVMPIHRLDEKPRQRAVLADITCDCDGKIDRFIDKEDVAKVLPLHASTPTSRITSPCSSSAPIRKPSATCTTC